MRLMDPTYVAACTAIEALRPTITSDEIEPTFTGLLYANVGRGVGGILPMVNELTIRILQ